VCHYRTIHYAHSCSTFWSESVRVQLTSTANKQYENPFYNTVIRCRYSIVLVQHSRFTAVGFGRWHSDCKPPTAEFSAPCWTKDPKCPYLYTSGRPSSNWWSGHTFFATTRWSCGIQQRPVLANEADKPFSTLIRHHIALLVEELYPGIF